MEAVCDHQKAFRARETCGKIACRSVLKATRVCRPVAFSLVAMTYPLRRSVSSCHGSGRTVTRRSDFAYVASSSRCQRTQRAPSNTAAGKSGSCLSSWYLRSEIPSSCAACDADKNTGAVRKHHSSGTPCVQRALIRAVRNRDTNYSRHWPLKFAVSYFGCGISARSSAMSASHSSSVPTFMSDS